MATAILLVAFGIRLVLLAAVLQLFGGRTWRLPTWIDRYLPHLSIEHDDGDPHVLTSVGAPEAGA